MKPAYPATNARVLDGTRSWMFIPKEAVTLDGSECNKIGVGYTAFKHEPGKLIFYQSILRKIQNKKGSCEKPIGSCLKNQLDYFYQQDLLKLKNGIFFYFFKKFLNYFAFF